MKMGKGAVAAVVLCASGVADADIVTVTFMIENLQPPNGNNLAPASFLTHNGTFDWFNLNQPGSEAVERLAEDGDNATLIANFTQHPGSGTAGHTAAGIMPGQSRIVQLQLDSADPRNRYFSFGAMFVPSNDAFIGNDNPLAYELFTAGGALVPRTGASAIVIDGPTGVWDAGREANDEAPANTAGLAQVAPNTGVTENNLVRLHPGFMGSVRLGGAVGPILTAHPGGDFTAPGALVARITVVPAPGTLLLGAAGMLALARRRR